MPDKPIILVTNDDDITSPGISTLVESMRELGQVVVVAPDRPQSGMGHAITIGDPLRLDDVDIFDGIQAYQCTGTPVDCVKLAVDKILHRKPDLCVSGINHGTNSSINVIYSGTMSAAMEAAIEGIPAIGFSLRDYSYHADMTAAGRMAIHISEKVLKHGLPVGTLLNVNIPSIPWDQIKGVQITRQALAKWKEDFDERIDPRGRKYYWMTGEFINMDDKEDTDEWALDNGYVSVVPTQFDLTSHDSIDFLKEKWNESDS